MKKILLLTVVALLTSISIFAQEEQERKQIQIQQGSAPQREGRNIDLVLNFTNFGFGVYMPFDGPMADFNFELLRIGIEGKGTNLGITFSPFNFSAIVGGGGDNEIPIAGSINFSFINLNMYWNMMGFLAFSDRFFIGPYGCINYLFLNPLAEGNQKAFYFDKFMVGAGLQGGVRGVSERVKYNIFTVDTGFRLVENKAKFYAGIKFDFIMNGLRNKGAFD